MAGLKRWLLILKGLVGRPYRAAQGRLGHLLFERGLQSTERPDVSSGHLFLYRGLLGSRIGQGDAFLDYGSGNGRVLLHAARFPFGRVIGLDLDEDALQVARANVSVAASRRRCKRIEVITGDATVWPVPDDVTYIYMFNPFRGEVFRAMLDRVVESLDRRPRPLTIIYAHPTCAEDLLRTGRFVRVRTSRGLRPGMFNQRIEIFRAEVPGT